MILFLILPFIHTFKELLLISLINKTYSNQLYSFLSIYPRKYEIFPRRTWINMVYCQICNTSYKSKLHQVNYFIDTPPRRCIVTCNKWQCRVESLQEYLYYLQSMQIFFFKPTLKYEQFFIPRSNPEITTKGHILWGNIIILKDGAFWIKVQWCEDNVIFRKLVLFKQFLEYNKKLKKINFFIRKIYLNNDTIKPKSFLYQTSDGLLLGEQQPPPVILSASGVKR